MQQNLNFFITIAVCATLVFLSSCASSTSTSDGLRSSPTSGSEIEVVSETFDTVEDIDAIRPDDIIARDKSHVKRSGEVYLMRGLADIWSRGIDEMADDMRERGIDASNFSYKYWEPIAQDIVRRQRAGKLSEPVVIIGHSLGANETSKFANYLGERNVSVALVVAFDPVETGYVGKNIGEVINYYLPKDEDNRIYPEKDFDGTIKNIDVTSNPEITHTNVEKRTKFQREVMREIIDRVVPVS